MNLPSDESLQRSLESIAPIGLPTRSVATTTATDPGGESLLADESVLATTASVKASNSKAAVLELANLVDGPLALEPFVDQTLSLIANVYGAQTVVLWMTDPTSPDALFRICSRGCGPNSVSNAPASNPTPNNPGPARSATKGLTPEPSELSNEQNLISQAWNCEQGTLHLEKSGLHEDDPSTVHPRLFAPVRHFDRTIALLDITLSPFSSAPPSSETRQRLILSASLIAQRIHSGLRRRLPLPPASPNDARNRLQNANRSVDAIREQMRLMIEKEISQLAGWSFSTFAENQEVAKEIHRLLDAHSLRVQCNECGNAAILRCIKAGNAKRGAFVFDHYLDNGRTFHGGTSSIPDLRVVPRPPRRGNSAEGPTDS